VRNLRLSSGTLTAFPDKIAEEFRQYYQSLYNLHERDGRDKRDTESIRVQEYLRDTVTKAIRPDAAEELDAMITAEDIQAALKSAKTGKAPSPDGFCSDTTKLFHQYCFHG
ncbi:Hypothetical predicted protein, partial [Pelobates cultripes]